MPWQLRLAHRPKRHEPRPLAELLPSVNVNDLKIPKVLNSSVTLPWISLRYPFLNGARLTPHMVELAHSGRTQSFRLKWIKTNYGRPRFAFICECGRPVISIYFRHGNLACRRCTGAIPASQACSKRLRPALQAHRVQTFLRLKPRLPRKTRYRLQARYGSTAKPVLATKRITGKALLPSLNYQTQAMPLWR